MNETSFGIYHSRALQLANAMRLCRDDLSAYASATALLAVHSAISYNDALLIRLNGKRPDGENHKQAITVIAQACKKHGLDNRGISQLEKLLSVKTEVSYGDRLVDSERVKRLCTAAERFYAWAEQILARREQTWL